MSLSKPLFDLLGTYFEQLYLHPVRTKSITSGILAASANLASQQIAGCKKINHDSIVAYGLFGLLFGGSLPHYFYQIMESILTSQKGLKPLLFFATERLIYTPMFQAVSLYALAILEGKSHSNAVNNLKALYWPILKANWSYLSLFVFINIKYVPPMLRVLVGNFIGFLWVIFLANKRRKLSEKLAGRGSNQAQNKNDYDN